MSNLQGGLAIAIVGLIVMLAGAILSELSFGILGSLLIWIGAIIFVVGLVIWLLYIMDM